MINLNPEKGNVELKNPVTVVRGIDGATFFPAVDENCVLSWSNDKELENPAPISLKGEKGEKGDKGDKGDAGYTPQKGIDYFDGEKGDKGDRGEKGDKGDAGYTPVKGVDYFDGAKGEKGEKGDKGEPGAKGEKGETGPKGDTGAQGPKGDKGETGATGPKGDKGEPGYTPVKGIDYFDGDKGPKGDKGDTGAKGPKGDTGAQGPKGDKGDKGDSYTLTEADKADIAAKVEVSGGNIDSFTTDEIKALCVISPKNFQMIFPDKEAQRAAGTLDSKLWLSIGSKLDDEYISKS